MSKERKRGMTKDQVIREVSNETELKYDAVMAVYNSLVNIFIRESVINEYFVIPDFLTVESHDRKPRPSKDRHGNEVVYPATRVLSARLSKKVNYYMRWKVRNDRNAKNGTTPETWVTFYMKADEDFEKE